jgi:hypothetical protein
MSPWTLVLNFFSLFFLPSLGFFSFPFLSLCFFTTILYKILTLGSSTLILVVQLSKYYMPIGLFLSYIYNKIQGLKGASFCGLITASVTLDITIVLRGKISDLVP